MKTIIGIDPGSRLCGWAVVQLERMRIKHVDNGVIVLNQTLGLEHRLAKLHRSVASLMGIFQPTDGAIESVFQHRNPQSALVLGQARGAALACLALEGVNVATYAPTEIKKLVAGHGRASKEQIQIMVSKHLELMEAPQADAADAAAVAICHALSLRLGHDSRPFIPAQRRKSKKQSDALLIQMAQRGRSVS